MKNILTGSICKIEALTETDIDCMYLLMAEFYDHMDRDIFLADLKAKDWCIVLRNEEDNILGFSTQKLLEIPVNGETIYGIFSGDTIIHKNHWGSMELFRVFARHFFDMADRYPRLYWFLISKGYKTYKLLPTFFREFYPNFKEETPPEIQAVMDAFGLFCYPDCYSPEDGVIHYRAVKDRLKEGVADLTPERLRDPHIAYFETANPGYRDGDDLVCLTILNRNNLIPRSGNLLFSGDQS